MEGHSSRVQNDVLQVEGIGGLAIQEVPIIERLLEVTFEQRLRFQGHGHERVTEEEVEGLQGEGFDVV